MQPGGSSALQNFRCLSHSLFLCLCLSLSSLRKASCVLFNRHTPIPAPPARRQKKAAAAAADKQPIAAIHRLHRRPLGRPGQGDERTTARCCTTWSSRPATSAWRRLRPQFVCRQDPQTPPETSRLLLLRPSLQQPPPPPPPTPPTTGLDRSSAGGTGVGRDGLDGHGQLSAVSQMPLHGFSLSVFSSELGSSRTARKAEKTRRDAGGESEEESRRRKSPTRL